MYMIYTLRNSECVYHVGIAPGDLPTCTKGTVIELLPYQFKTLSEAIVYQQQVMSHHGVKIGHRIFSAVICNETGETFPNANACAKAHEIANSALINHLNNKPGHRSVKGRTYRRVDA